VVSELKVKLDLLLGVVMAPKKQPQDYMLEEPVEDRVAPLESIREEELMPREDRDEPEVKRNKGARSYSPKNNWKSSSRWVGPTLVSWWWPSKREPPRVKGSNRPSPGTSMVPATARFWMLGLRKWTTTYMPPRLDEIPPWSLPNPT